MKTAISLPDALFERAERYAQVKRLSRSELYAKALETYLSQYEDTTITAQLDALYAGEDSALSPEVGELGFTVLRRAEN